MPDDTSEVLREIRTVAETLTAIDRAGALQAQALEHLAARLEEHRQVTDTRMDRLHARVGSYEERLRSVEMSRSQLVGIYLGVSALAAVIGSLASYALGHLSG